MNVALIGAVLAVVFVAYMLFRAVASAFRLTTKLALWAFVAVVLIAGFYFIRNDASDGELTRFGDLPAVRLPDVHDSPWD